MKRKSTINILIMLFVLLAEESSYCQDYASSSVLSGGTWKKIAVTGPGVYKLTYSQISDMGFADPSSIAIFGNNTGQLSYINDGTAPDDLEEIAIVTEKGSDNLFNEGDYILFYGEGTHRWNYDSEKGENIFNRHNYSDTAFYFITSRSGGGKNAVTETQPTENAGLFSTSADFCYRYELENVSLIKSGREWYQMVASGNEISVTPPVENIIASERIHYTIRVLARSDSYSSFTFKQAGTTLKTISVPAVNMSDINGVYANIVSVTDSCFPASSFTLLFSNNDNLSATGYIDYVDFHGRRELVYNGAQLSFSDSKTTGASNITQFSIVSSAKLQVWDVTDPFAPLIIETGYSGGRTVFKAATDALRTFIAFTPSEALTPVISGNTIVNQDLHALQGADMIIVTHPLFREYAETLASMHLADDGTTSIVVTPQQIYNEFSGGIRDAVAIRNFVKMIYDRSKSTSSPLKYLLLFGDGSYENKTMPPNNTSYIPTWQSVNSHIGVLSFTSDDFYGLLDEGEGEAAGYLDIGIGRLPVADTTSAGIVIRKIASYMSPSSFGSWRNNLCIVADDEDSNLHMTDAESLATIISAAAPSLTIEKIYLDAYRQETSVSGNSYPDAVTAIDNRIDNGCLIFNYIGHGSETGLAHERVVRTDNINSWNNGEKLPLFITATCEFSRFDDVEINSSTRVISSRTSAGEMVLLNPDGGGIGLMSTTRVVYSAPNYTLTSNIFDNAFATADDGQSMRMGDIIKLAKINSGAGTNKRNFLLLGDPALKLAYPARGEIVTDSINHVSVAMATDTLKALSLITVSGHITDSDGNPATDFNGTIIPTVFDKESTLTTLGNDGDTPITFSVPGSTLFRGTAIVTDGYFSFSFLVPLDINYSYGQGKITYYAYNQEEDYTGSCGSVIVGGFSDYDITDMTGPEIRLFMNDTLFTEGGITDTSPALLALISDESGINASGAGIGHDIIAWLDGDQSSSVTLNSLYRTDADTHSSGSLIYPLEIAEKGEHTITLRAWDNLNNPSVATLTFFVETDGRFSLKNLVGYPNPSEGEVKFRAEHNRPDESMSIRIYILSTSGQIMRIINDEVFTEGYKIPDISWDGCNSSGNRLPRGLYIWRIEAETADGENASSAAKIIIL